MGDLVHAWCLSFGEVKWPTIFGTYAFGEALVDYAQLPWVIEYLQELLTNAIYVFWEERGCVWAKVFIGEVGKMSAIFYDMLQIILVGLLHNLYSFLMSSVENGTTQ